MTFESNLFDLLDGVLGESVAGRIYPVRAPEEAERDAKQDPVVIYTVDGETRGRLFCGTDDLRTRTVRVDVYSHDYDTASAISDTLSVALDGYRGGAFSPVFVESVVDLGDVEPGIYRRELVLTIWFK